MTEDSDLLIKLHEEEWSLIRHYEEQRATITNIVLVIASVAVGLIVQKGVTMDSLPVAILLAALGIYGAVSVTKLYERTQYANAVEGHFAARLDELHPNAKIRQLKAEAQAAHKARFPRMSRLHMNHLWLTLHIAVALLGVGLVAAIIFR